MAGIGGYTPPRITSAQFFIEETVLKVKGWGNHEHFYLFFKVHLGQDTISSILPIMDL
jgi:hypothetical protein